MYNELYEVWKRELERSELERLPRDLFPRIADYLKRLREESRMIDRKTVKAHLLKKEMQNVKRLTHDLIQTRCKKIARKAIKGERFPSDVLTTEEESVFTGFSPLQEASENFVKRILEGRVPAVEVEKERKRTILRFLKDVPAIIGADMKTYGPFKVEDVASLPIENAKILIKQGLAERAEV